MKKEPKQQNWDAYALYALGSRLHWVQRANPRIYISYNKKGEKCLEFNDENEVILEERKGHTVKVARNKTVIAQLKKSILYLERKLGRDKSIRP
jgi:hypothetical protein